MVMKSKILHILKSKKAATMVQTVMIFLVLMIILSVVMEYASIVSIGNQAQSTAQNVLDSIVMKSAMDLFESVKNGRSSIADWQLEADATLKDTLEKKNEASFPEQLVKKLGATKQDGEKHYLGNGNGEAPIFFVPDKEIKLKTKTENYLLVESGVTVGRDIMFMGMRVADVSMHISVNSRYTKKSAISTGQEVTTRVQETGNLLERSGDSVTKATPPTPPTTRPDVTKSPSPEGEIGGLN